MAGPFEAFARFEHDGWERVAARYDGVWTTLTTAFGERLLDAVEFGPGTRLLDEIGRAHV